MECKARLRRLWRITCSKTISPLEALSCQLSAIGYQLSAIGYNKPSASQGEARLRGREQSHYSKTIISVIAWGALFPGAFNSVQQVQPL
jgi:hypothetical protein